MKDRVREAVFNLVGPAVKGKHAVDLFAGTGALGLEALSRGAAQATLIEQHYPTAAVIRSNIQALGVAANCELVHADALLWVRQTPRLALIPWLVFCSPPYDLYRLREAEMIGLLAYLAESIPAQSIIVVEADERFDPALLPHPSEWDIRRYPPAVIGIYRKGS
jgi:16S rRNA (guanine966-N2)-methyltransferase